MKNLLRTILLISIISILVACGAKSKDDIVNDARKKIDDVNIYHVDMNLAFKMESVHGNKTSSANLVGTFDEKTLDFDIKTTEKSDDNSAQVHLYKVGDDAYFNNNNSGWVKLDINEIDDSDNSTSYGNIMRAVDNVRELLEMKDEKDVYRFSYEGNDLKLFKAFEAPFNLAFTGFDLEKESKMSLDVEIDKKTSFIKTLKFTIDVENPEAKVNMTADVKYDKINNTKVEIPADVKSATK